MKATVVGTAKVMSYDDIVKAQEKRVAREAKTPNQPQRDRKRQTTVVTQDQHKRPRLEEAEKANREIEALSLTKYCSIFQF